MVIVTTVHADRELRSDLLRSDLHSVIAGLRSLSLPESAVCGLLVSAACQLYRKLVPLPGAISLERISSNLIMPTIERKEGLGGKGHAQARGQIKLIDIGLIL
jgi:hypothetical protein